MYSMLWVVNCPPTSLHPTIEECQVHAKRFQIEGERAGFQSTTKGSVHSTRSSKVTGVVAIYDQR